MRTDGSGKRRVIAWYAYSTLESFLSWTDWSGDAQLTAQVTTASRLGNNPSAYIYDTTIRPWNIFHVQRLRWAEKR